MAARILLVRPDARELTAMQRILSDRYTVLTAQTPAEAMQLLSRHGPCSLAYCEVGSHPGTDLDWTRPMAESGMAVVALSTSPNTPGLADAVRRGYIHGICLLPLSRQALLAKTSEMLGRACPLPSPPIPQVRTCVLTREEIRFLLDWVPTPRSPRAARPSRGL